MSHQFESHSRRPLECRTCGQDRDSHPASAVSDADKRIIRSTPR